LTIEESAALAAALQIYGIVPQTLESGFQSIELFDGCFEIVLDWSRLLSDRVLSECLYILLGKEEPLTFGNVSRAQPLSGLVKKLKNAWVLEMLRESRFATHYQPIVEAANPDRIFAHECLMRGVAKDGKLVPPGAVLDAADEEGMMFHLDRICRLTAIDGFASQRVGGKAFINFNPTSVYNPVACLQSTVAAAKAVGLRPDQIVFELIERDHVADEAHLLRVVNFYRSAGYGIALDDVGAGYSGLNLLSTLKPDYIKLDMHLIRDVDKDEVKQSIVSNLLQMSRTLNIRTIVEGVETQEEYQFAVQQGADFVQGYLFAKPAATAKRDLETSKAA
jgi:EAL domain-containing protein (putative c-di-GMP-specific phosphodiesterase class I)